MRQNVCTNPSLAALATEMAALRRSGVTIRGIALAMGRSPSGVQRMLRRLGLGGMRWPRTRRPVRLGPQAREAVAMLLHPHARRLTWRQQTVLWSRVRGESPGSIAADLGIRPDGVRSLVATARRCLETPSPRQRSRRRSHRPDAAWIDLGCLLA